MGLNKNAVIPQFAWLLLGLVLALSGGMMFGSKSVNIRDFYNDGETFHVSTSPDSVNLADVSYDAAKGIYHVDSDNAKLTFKKGKKDVQYYYLYLKAENINQNGINAMFGFYNKSGRRVCTYENAIGNGWNVYTLPVTGDFCRMKIFLKNQKDLEFSLKEISFRQKLMTFSKKRFLGGAAGVFFLYLFFSWMIYRKYPLGNKIEKSYECLVTKFCDILQYIYKLEEKPARRLCGLIPPHRRSVFRVIMLFLLQMYFFAANKLGVYNDRYTKYHIFLAAVILLFTAWSMYEGNLETQKWNKDFFGCFSMFCLVLCICDAWMGSRYLGVGYVLLLAGGSLFFFWGNQKTVEKEQFLNELFISGGAALVIQLIAVLFTMDVKGVFGLPIGVRGEDLLIAWKTYAGDINLLGHADLAKTGGIRINGYNGILQMCHRYGVLVLVPYGIFLVNVLKSGIMAKDKKMLVVEGVYLVLLMVTEAETPFLTPFWTVFYLHIGYWLFERPLRPESCAGEMKI